MFSFCSFSMFLVLLPLCQNFDMFSVSFPASCVQERVPYTYRNTSYSIIYLFSTQIDIHISQLFPVIRTMPI